VRKEETAMETAANTVNNATIYHYLLIVVASIGFMIHICLVYFSTEILKKLGANEVVSFADLFIKLNSAAICICTVVLLLQGIYPIRFLGISFFLIGALGVRYFLAKKTVEKKEEAQAPEKPGKGGS